MPLAGIVSMTFQQQQALFCIGTGYGSAEPLLLETARSSLFLRLAFVHLGSDTVLVCLVAGHAVAD